MWRGLLFAVALHVLAFGSAVLHASYADQTGMMMGMGGAGGATFTGHLENDDASAILTDDSGNELTPQ